MNRKSRRELKQGYNPFLFNTGINPLLSRKAVSTAQYLTLSANAGIGYDALNDRASLTSNFVSGGPAFITRGIDQSPWVGHGGVGLMVNQFHDVEITARYDIEARSDYTDQTASLKFRLPF